jgi:hypothetical protein
MKNLTILTVAAALCMFFNSCKKCNDCVKQCEICSHSIYSTETECRTDYPTDADYLVAIDDLENDGYSCSSADEEDEVCTSGLFFKLRHQEEIDSKEAEGFDCN